MEGTKAEPTPEKQKDVLDEGSQGSIDLSPEEKDKRIKKLKIPIATQVPTMDNRIFDNTDAAKPERKLT